jgi:membrane-associated phospholipid phosphatase
MGETLHQNADPEKSALFSSTSKQEFRFSLRNWLLSLLFCLVAILIAFPWLDLPIAEHLFGILGTSKTLGNGFASVVLLGIEAAVVLALVISRLLRGHLTPFQEATAIACLTSICAYAVNDTLIKPLFGVPCPALVFQGATHAIHFLDGAAGNSFPSGHMVLACSFAGVFIRLYRSLALPLSILLCIGAILLIGGSWHFLSDVIAGSFVGLSVGILAGEAWLAHSRRSNA